MSELRNIPETLRATADAAEQRCPSCDDGDEAAECFCFRGMDARDALASMGLTTDATGIRTARALATVVEALEEIAGRCDSYCPPNCEGGIFGRHAPEPEDIPRIADQALTTVQQRLEKI